MARLDERAAEARRAVDRLASTPAIAVDAAGDGETAATAADARLLRFAIAFEAVWYAARQLMLDRYGPIQGTADGTVRACGEVALLPVEAVAQLRLTAVFHERLMERCRREGPDGPAAELAPHAAAVADWLTAVEQDIEARPRAEPGR